VLGFILEHLINSGIRGKNAVSAFEIIFSVAKTGWFLLGFDGFGRDSQKMEVFQGSKF
jgi:hypothetical protein